MRHYLEEPSTMLGLLTTLVATLLVCLLLATPSRAAEFFKDVDGNAITRQLYLYGLAYGGICLKSAAARPAIVHRLAELGIKPNKLDEWNAFKAYPDFVNRLWDMERYQGLDLQANLCQPMHELLGDL
jgi:hypothetical protein